MDDKIRTIPRKACDLSQRREQLFLDGYRLPNKSRCSVILENIYD